MDILDFLLELDREISVFTESISNTESITVNDRRDDILKYELALMYYSVITFYFRETGISSDQNIMEQEEIQVVIDKLNNIMGTYLYTDYS
jgi:hypothetical protein